jgi:hypothetical protein
VKLFVVVRLDLSHSQRAVQAGHALAEYMLNSPRWQNSTLIYLGVKGLTQLEHLKLKLDYNDIKYVEFKEPDLDNQTTAIASDEDSAIFEKLNLL